MAENSPAPRLHQLPEPAFGGAITHVRPYDWRNHAEGCTVTVDFGVVVDGAFVADPAFPARPYAITGPEWYALATAPTQLPAAAPFAVALAALGDAALAVLDARGWFTPSTP